MLQKSNVTVSFRDMQYSLGLVSPAYNIARYSR